MRSIAAIAAREFKAYLASTIGYVVAAMFLLLSGYFLTRSVRRKHATGSATSR
jgi:peptidoglycan/LPS O-acetylase OafA/YrhL